MYYSYLYDQKLLEYFKSKWAHQLLHKSHLNRSPPHYIAIVYFSSLHK